MSWITFKPHIRTLVPPPIPKISDGAHPQAASPLFSRFPTEIRQKIYTYVLSSFDDVSKPFNPQHHHYRPGHEYRQKYDLALLQTCKRIYHEARLLPISLNEIVIYLYRGPRSNLPKYSQHDWRMRYWILNRDQREAVQTLHLFAQQCYLESTLHLLYPSRFQPTIKDTASNRPIETFEVTAKKLVLTFRRSDWWSWESPVMSNDQLGICPWRCGRTDWKQMEAEPLEAPSREWNAWGGQFRYVAGLEHLEIEFETLLTKRKQLERVVARAKHWKFPLMEDRILSWTGDVEESTWEGSVNLKEDNGDRAVQLRSVREDTVLAEPPKCTNLIMTMRWRAVKGG